MKPLTLRWQDTQPYGQCFYLDVHCDWTLIRHSSNGSAQAERLACNLHSILVAPVILQTKLWECLCVSKSCSVTPPELIKLHFSTCPKATSNCPHTKIMKQYVSEVWKAAELMVLLCFAFSLWSWEITDQFWQTSFCILMAIRKHARWSIYL